MTDHSQHSGHADIALAQALTRLAGLGLLIWALVGVLRGYTIGEMLVIAVVGHGLINW